MVAFVNALTGAMVLHVLEFSLHMFGTGHRGESSREPGERGDNTCRDARFGRPFSIVRKASVEQTIAFGECCCLSTSDLARTC